MDIALKARRAGMRPRRAGVAFAVTDRSALEIGVTVAARTAVVAALVRAGRT